MGERVGDYLGGKWCHRHDIQLERWQDLANPHETAVGKIVPEKRDVSDVELQWGALHRASMVEVHSIAYRPGFEEPEDRYDRWLQLLEE